MNMIFIRLALNLFKFPTQMRKDGRATEGARLESVYTSQAYRGCRTNTPSLSCLINRQLIFLIYNNVMVMTCPEIFRPR